jgi:hypothetical protein
LVHDVYVIVQLSAANEEAKRVHDTKSSAILEMAGEWERKLKETEANFQTKMV